MTKLYPDSARLIWIGSFLAFAACGNAEQAEKEFGLVATGIQRHIAYLEAWLGRVLITDANPAKLADYAFDFVEIALEVDRLIDARKLKQDLGRVRILSTGVVLLDGYQINWGEAFQIGQLLRGCRSYIRPRTEAEIAHAKADRLHRLISSNLQKISMNIRLYERSPPTPARLDALESSRVSLKAGKNMLAFLEKRFGPFQRTSGASIDMSWWNPDQPQAINL